MFAHLGVWFFFGYIIHMFVKQLNTDHHSDPEVSARLLHGRAGLADRVRGHAVRVREAAGQDRPPARRRGRRLREDRTMATQSGRTFGLHQEPRPHVRPVHRRLPRLHRPARGPRAGRRSEQGPRLSVRVLHAGGLRHHRRRDAHGGGLGILRRRPARAGLLQRHGDRRRLDVGGLLRRHGRHAVPARLRRPRLGARLDRRLRAGVDPGRTVPAQVRRLHRARLHVVPVRRQLHALPGRDRAGVLLLHLRDGADLRHGPDRLALPRHAVRASRCSPASSASCCARCWAACGR